jgi:hypothetical protein
MVTIARSYTVLIPQPRLATTSKAPTLRTKRRVGAAGLAKGHPMRDHPDAPRPPRRGIPARAFPGAASCARFGTLQQPLEVVGERPGMSSYHATVNRRHAPWRAPLVAALVLLLVMLALPAAAKPTHGGKWVPFRATGHSVSRELIERECPEPAEGETLFKIRANTEFDKTAPGDTFKGTGRSEGCFYLRGDVDVGSAHAFGELEIDGTIDGCGAGTFRVSYVAEFSEADAATGYRTGWDIAQLIPGSGTGDFQRVSRARWFATSSISPLPDLQLTGTADGWVKC